MEVAFFFPLSVRKCSACTCVRVCLAVMQSVSGEAALRWSPQCVGVSWWLYFMLQFCQIPSVFMRYISLLNLLSIIYQRVAAFSDIRPMCLWAKANTCACARACPQKEQQSVCCVNLSACDAEVVNSPREPIPQQLVTAESTHGKCGADRGARTDLRWQLANHLWKMSFPWWHQQGPLERFSSSNTDSMTEQEVHRRNGSSYIWKESRYVQMLRGCRILKLLLSGHLGIEIPVQKLWVFSNSDLFKTNTKKSLG